MTTEATMTNTSEANERGLYNKYLVARMDGSSREGGKHFGCEYFVLDITHDPHARSALAAYADSCRYQYPQLAADLEVKTRGGKLAAPSPSTPTAEDFTDTMDGAFDNHTSPSTVGSE